MPYVFDPLTRVITLPEAVGGVATINVEEIYDEAKQWYLSVHQRKQAPFPFATSGGEDLTPGIDAGAYYQLQNQAQFGWRLRPYEADANYYFVGNLTPADSAIDILIPTIGNFTVGIFGLQPITQSVSEILEISQQQQYGNKVYIDTIGGQSGSDRPIGTAAFPTNNLADALIIQARENTNEFVLVGTITLNQAFTNTIFTGLGASEQSTIELNGQNVDGSYFDRIELDGAGSGTVETDWSHVHGVSGLAGTFRRTAIAMNFTMGGNCTFIESYSHQVGNSKPTVSMAGGAFELAFRGHIGGVAVANVSNALAKVSLDLDPGRVELQSSCTAGECVLGGSTHLVDNSAGMTIFDRRDSRILLEEVIDAGYTVEQLVRLIASEAAAKIVQAGDGTYAIRDLADTKDRITGDDAANGGRTTTIADAT